MRRRRPRKRYIFTALASILLSGGALIVKYQHEIFTLIDNIIEQVFEDSSNTDSHQTNESE